MTQPAEEETPKRSLVVLGCAADGSQLAVTESGTITPHICLIMALKLIMRAREIEVTRTWGWQFDPNKPAAVLPLKLDDLENHLRRIFSQEDDALTGSEALT